MVNPINIVILDAGAISSNDFSWEHFKELGQLKIYHTSTPEEALERVQDADALIVNKVAITRQLIDAAPRLKYIGENATGFNNIDIDYARSKGIIVCNVPEYSTPSVVQMVFAHILNFSCRFVTHTQSVKKGDWVRSETFCYRTEKLFELRGKTLGIMGLGKIGQTIIPIAQSFGMDVIGYHYKPLDIGIKQVSMQQLAERSDIISLHIPLNEDTSKIVNADFIKNMKPSAFLINTARGGLIDEDALAEALNNEQISGAGLEVLTQEPPSADNPLISAKNCYITPHNCWLTDEATGRLMQITFENVQKWQAGVPQNVVN